MMEKYKFESIYKKYAFLSDKDVSKLLEKWNVELEINSFNYDKAADDVDIPKLLKHLFEDEAVLSSLKIDRHVNKVEVEQLGTSIMSMEFFDRLKNHNLEPPILRPNGAICGCNPDILDGMKVEDELRRCLLSEESENFSIFNEDDRAEFIFNLFKSLVIGGPLCQYEDQIEPYFETTKSIYKDLVSVKQSGGQKSIRSKIFQLQILNSRDGSESIFQPGGKVSRHPQTSCFVIIDPFCRHITLLSHKWIEGKIW